MRHVVAFSSIARWREEVPEKSGHVVSQPEEKSVHIDYTAVISKSKSIVPSLKVERMHMHVHTHTHTHTHTSHI